MCYFVGYQYRILLESQTNNVTSQYGKPNNLYSFGLEILEFCHSVLWQNYYACGVVLSLGDEVLSLYDEVCCLRVEFPSRCVEVIF